MKDLNLNAMGVTEMSAKEVSAIDGGFRYFIDGIEGGMSNTLMLTLITIGADIDIYGDGTPAQW